MSVFFNLLLKNVRSKPEKLYFDYGLTITLDIIGYRTHICK